MVLIHALGYRSVQCVVGHDCGAMMAVTCSLIRPDFLRSVVLMSLPFNGCPELPLNTANECSVDEHRAATAKGGGGGTEGSAPASGIHQDLAEHYKWYHSTSQANS